MRGTAWVNTFQTCLFLVFGLITMAVIAQGMGGFRDAVERLASQAATASLLTREKVSPLYFFSYTFIPLSSIAFPHITIFCLTARKMAQFKKTVIFYPLCMIAIWLPCVLLGVVANQATEAPAIAAKLEARQQLAEQGPTLTAGQKQALRGKAAGDDILPTLLGHYAPVWLAGLLGAGIMAAVMASDSQILALSTMAAEDLFAFYGGTRRFGEHVQVVTGRAFVVALTVLAYGIALRLPQSIFDIAVQYAFTGYSALFPLLVAALFWRGSTKWGALAATVWVAAAVVGIAILQAQVPAPPPGAVTVLARAGGVDLLARTTAGLTVGGFLPVVPVTLISGFLVWFVSLLTPRPSESTIRRYFP
jgi:SSS family solute:Na+ symporter